MTNKREHHAIPRFYLSGFAHAGSSFVWAYRRGRPYSPGKKKGRDNPYLAALGVTTTERDRYTVVDLNGTRHFNLIEDMMREWEEFGKPAIIRIRERQALNHADKERLARYIGCMWRRVEKHEQSATEIYQRELESGEPYHLASPNLACSGSRHRQKAPWIICDQIRAASTPY